VYDDYYLKKAFTAPFTEEGFLSIQVASAILPGCGDKVTLKLGTPDQKSYTLSPQQVIGEEYQFNSPHVCPVKFTKDDMILGIQLELKNNKEIIGECFVNWSECLFFTKENSENKAFLLYKGKERTKFKVYMRFHFLTKAQAQLMKLDDKKDIGKDKASFINGIMKVGIMRAKNLVGDEKGDDGKMKSDPLVVFKFKNHDKYVKYTTNEVENNLNPIWNEDFSFAVKILKDGAIPPFEIEVYDHDTWSSNDQIGQTKIKPDKCFSTPCNWVLNQFFPLQDAEKKGSGGELYLRAYFVPEGTFDPNVNPKDVETGEEYKIKSNGAKLHLRMVAGRNLVYLKETIPQPTASPYVEITLPSGKTKETRPITNSLNPNWFYNYIGALDVPEDASKLKPVLATVFHKTGMLSRDVKMSQVSIDLKKCIENKGKWIINEEFVLPGEEKLLRPNNLKNLGTLYVQAKVVESSRIDDEIEPEMLIELPKLAEGEIKGTILVNVIHCKDLPVSDSGIEGSLTDAFVKFSTPGASDSVETPVMPNNLNPVWNKKLLMQYRVSNITEVQPLLVSVMDHDRMSTNDLLGTVEVDLLPCLSKAGEWSINKIYDLTNVPKELKKKGETPQIYFQLKFLKDGQVDEGEPPALLEDLNRTIGDRKRKGTLVIRVIHARGLIRADTGLAGSSSDPYAELTVYPEGKTYKTKVIKDCLIPAWREEFRHKIDVSDVRYVPLTQLKVYDYDNLLAGGTDDLIGTQEIDIKPALNDKNAWAINQVFELSGPAILKEKLKLKNFGHIYIQMLFLPDGEEMTKKEPALIEDIDKLSKEAETKGTLYVNCVHAKDLMKNDKPWFGGGPGSSDPLVRIKWPNGKTSDTEHRNGTTNPVWNQLLKSQVELNKLNIPLLYVEVMDYEALSNDQLGFCYVDIDECVKKPGKWIVNGNQALEGGPKFAKAYSKFGEVYLQVMYLEGNAAFDGNLPPVTENLKEVIERAAIKGQIEIFLVHGENLPAGDTNGKSDPFITFTMPDKKEIDSKVIKDTLNPIWNQEIKYPIAINTTTVEPIELRVVDQDPLSNDSLGRASFPIYECLKQPGKWLVDDFIKLLPIKPKPKKDGDDDAKPEDLGEIYLQARFVKDGETNNTPHPPLKKDLAKIMADKRIDGDLVVRLVHCKGLHVEKPSSCKVFAKLQLGDDEKSTNYVNQRNPFFNETFKFPVHVDSKDFLKPVAWSYSSWSSKPMRNSLLPSLRWERSASI
jgi:hypothetical protein